MRKQREDIGPEVREMHSMYAYESLGNWNKTSSTYYCLLILIIACLSSYQKYVLVTKLDFEIGPYHTTGPYMDTVGRVGDGGGIASVGPPAKT